MSTSVSRCRPRLARRRGHRGAAAVEVALVAPAVLVLVSLFAFGYRLWATRSNVLSAAEAGARAATMAHSPSQGVAEGTDVAKSDLGTLSVHCSSTTVSVDAAALAAPPGTVGSVTVTITCRVPMSDLAIPGAPGTVTVTRSATERLNTYAER